MKRGVIKFAQALSGQDDDVQAAQFWLVQPERFTGDALDSVAINRAPNTFLGNDQTQSWMLEVVRPGKQQYAGSGSFAGGSIEYDLELSRREKSEFRFEPVIHLRCRTYADRRLRPLARRRASTLRPLDVAMRARKP